MNTGASKTSAGAVGGAAVVLAVILPVFIPTLHLDGLGLFGPGGSGGDGVKVVNPIIDMNRNLQRGANIPLLDITTDDPDPSYLRIAVLTQYNGNEWTAGNRQVISDQTRGRPGPARGARPERQPPARLLQLHGARHRRLPSTWLPTQFPVSDINADGDWHYDTTTMDFRSSTNATAAGLTYTMTAAKPQYSGTAMARSLTAPPAIQSSLHRGPVDRSRRRSTTTRWRPRQGAESRYQQAVMLQRWFRDTGGFRYNLKRHTGDGAGNAALLHFLSPGPDGRVGYCEQFAAAYAVMARTLQIPARVAVGFLEPHPGDDEGRVGLQGARPACLARAVLPGIRLGAVRADSGGPRGDPPDYTTGAVGTPKDPRSARRPVAG